MNVSRIFSCILCTIILSQSLDLSAATTTVTTSKIDDATLALTLTMQLAPDEFMYKDYLDFSVDQPNITLSQVKIDQEATNHYDTSFKENKKAYKDRVSFTIHATKDTPWTERDSANLHVAYYLTSRKAIGEEIVPLALAPSTPPALSYAVEAEDTAIVDQEQSAPENTAKKVCVPEKPSFASRISALAQTTQSLWLRLLLVFLLGVLLSLTPCIYPMIPITVGILQSRGSSSVLSNFAISCCYVFGIATTFALLGIMAAFTGQIFGSIMSNPFVILAIVALLIYLALSMFGLYEMYIPKSFQNNRASVQAGSYLSVFIFGAISGSVASPCLSPGLVLLLSIVTTLGSKLLGFALLFAFGVGLGVPLLIIGTFSSSLTLLPKAGMWMVEIKKLSGLLLLGMCFYFLKTILPLAVILWLLTLFLVASGLWLFYDTKNTFSSGWKLVKNLIGIGCIALSVLVAVHAHKATYAAAAQEESIWHTDYEKAIELAKSHGKVVFIDVGAPYCSICTAIEKSLLSHEKVLMTLNQCIPLKIDGSDTSNAACQMLQKKYNIVGFPTYLLIDPHTGSLLKQWGSELYETHHEEFIKELEKHF